MRRGGATSLVAFATLMRNGRARKRPAQVHKRRAGPRRTELDHVGAYNFMVEIEGIGSSGWDFGTPQVRAAPELPAELRPGGQRGATARAWRPARSLRLT
eukprot:293165-Rhodomonas_salina.1